VPIAQLNPNQKQSTETDNRPRFGIGHLALAAGDVDRLTDFYTTIGMRLVVNMGRMAIVELRGGTHIILQQGRPGTGALDLIVDDIDETRDVMVAAGAQDVTSITRGNPHDRFTATDPEGNTLVIASNHAIGAV